jgi:ADP-ribose pyrophosphatase YjhB (NUDIX family)
MSKEILCKTNIDTHEMVQVEKLTFRPSAYGIIINNEKIVTLENKSNDKIWFPGGGVEIGETLEEGLKREIKEETSLCNVEVHKMILFKENFFYYKPFDEAYHAFLFFYLCTTEDTKLAIEADDEESINPQWTDISSIKTEDLSDLNEDLFQLLQSLKQPNL